MNVRTIQQAFDAAGILELPDAALARMLVYVELLLRWNSRLSLTSLQDPEQIIQRHLVECALAAQHLPIGLDTLLDYGSGAGLPGLVFAIMRPDIRVTLAEAHRKKAAFLLEVRRSAALDCEVYSGRVEDLAQGLGFDAVSMRAVEKMKVAIPIAIKRVRHYLILFATEETIGGFQEVGKDLEWVSPIRLPNSEQMILAIAKRRI